MFHEKIKETRVRRNMTQKQLADAAQIAAGSVSAYENGQKLPPVNAAGRIAAALGVSLDWLLNDDPFEDLSFCVADSMRDLAKSFATIVSSSVVLDAGMDTGNDELNRFVQQAATMKTLCRKGEIDESVFITWLDAKVRKITGRIK